MLIVALILGAYLLGSVSTAVIVSRALGHPDPRSQGSGNPGATNVLRLGGKKAGALTLAGDVLKGVFPVLIARWLTADPAVVVTVGVAAFLGHLFPLFFGFKGGKGVATALGALGAIAWPVGLATAIVWLLVAVASRYSSLASMLAAVTAPFLAALFNEAIVTVVGVALMSMFLLLRHRANIGRLLAGEESRIKLSRS